MSKPRRIPTEDEYLKNKQVILDAFKNGLPIRRMLARFNYTRTYIAKMRDTLISEGLITEDEIKSASAQYYKENPNAQGLDKSRIRKSKGKKAERRHNRSLENKEKVFELVKQKYTKSQIARELEIHLSSVRSYIKALIEER